MHQAKRFICLVFLVMTSWSRQHRANIRVRAQAVSQIIGKKISPMHKRLRQSRQFIVLGTEMRTAGVSRAKLEVKPQKVGP